MEKGFRLREVFNAHEVISLSHRLHTVYENFDEQGFQDYIIPQLKENNYKERSTLIEHALNQFLPKDFEISAQLLIDVLPPEREEPELSGYEGFIIIPMSMYIANHGMRYFDMSMKALYEMTKRFSSEYAIRVFLEKEPEKTLKIMSGWVYDENPHVRRLVSEGTRPRLPLCTRLPRFQEDPAPVLNLIEKLKDDKELYVRRSVANNLNDISKDNPKIVIALLKEWKKDATKETEWIISHALRTLLREGRVDALSLMGYKEPYVTLTGFTLSSDIVAIGSLLTFDISLQCVRNQDLMIDYAVHYMKANGKKKAKIFKLAKKTVKENTVLTLSGKHSFKQMTTRKHYPGGHIIEIIVNGKRLEKKYFTLAE